MGNNTSGIRLNGFGGEIVARSGCAFVEKLDAPGGPLHAVHVAGTHYEMGRQIGAMLGEKIYGSFAMVQGMLGESGLPGPFVTAIGSRAWSFYAKHVPAVYLDELRGIADAAREAGVPLTLEMLETVAAVPEFTSYWQMEKMLSLLMEEPQEDVEPVWDGKERKSPPIQCSAYMAWGSRCEQGKLYGCRNLDWAKDTGMAANKCVTVYHPVGENGEPGPASAVFGYIGFLGALAGINENGVALGEIGAFNERETLDGRPWHYVFREVLDTARNLKEACDIIAKGHFVQGYCFNIGWGDPRGFGTPAFAPAGVSVEVDAQYTEILADDDARERGAVAVGRSGETLLFDGRPKPYGIALKDAVVRADTAFSKTVRSGQYTDKGPAGENNSGDATQGRTWRDLYRPISLAIRSLTEGLPFEDAKGRWARYAAPGPAHPMTAAEAMEICAAAGDNKDNVISIFYDATALEASVAFETGSADTWRPAAQAGYTRLKLAEVFAAGRD